MNPKKNSVAFSALKYNDFRFYLGTQFLFTLGILIQEVCIGYFLYDNTGDPLVLGIVGLAEALPYICIALFGGFIADNFNRKIIVKICFSVVIIVSGLLYYLIEDSFQRGFSTGTLYSIYGCLLLLGTARGIYGPAWSSLKPFLVDIKDYANAAAWSSQAWQLGMILGPLSSGFLYAWIGISNTLILVISIFIIAFLCVVMIKKDIEVIKTFGNIFSSLKEGFSFVYKEKILFYAIALDMISVLFGGVIAILPVFAKDILEVGPIGFGWLRAAPGIGALFTMFLLAFYPPTQQAWRNMLLAVFGFGIATLVFAFSKNFSLSLLALFLTGAFDAVSVVIRQTILQLLPPDHMRGRVASINGIFVSCSNELGAFESGLAARLMGTIPSVIFGATMTISIVSFVYLKTKDLFTINLQAYTNNSTNS